MSHPRCGSRASRACDGRSSRRDSSSADLASVPPRGWGARVSAGPYPAAWVVSPDPNGGCAAGQGMDTPSVARPQRQRPHRRSGRPSVLRPRHRCRTRRRAHRLLPAGSHGLAAPARRAGDDSAATDAISGSVKTTCGTARSSAVAACRPHRPSSTASPLARATMTSPTARAGHLPGRTKRRATPQQRLGRHASPVRALTSDQFPLDDGCAQAALHHPVGDVLPHRARTDDDDVVRRCPCQSALLARPRRSAETRKKIPPRTA